MIKAQAKRKDNREIFKSKGIIKDKYGNVYLLDEVRGGLRMDMAHEVDPQTLKYSFDDGKTWRTEKEIEQALVRMDITKRRT